MASSALLGVRRVVSETFDGKADTVASLYDEWDTLSGWMLFFVNLPKRLGWFSRQNFLDFADILIYLELRSTNRVLFCVQENTMQLAVRLWLYEDNIESSLGSRALTYCIGFGGPTALERIKDIVGSAESVVEFALDYLGAAMDNMDAIMYSLDVLLLLARPNANGTGDATAFQGLIVQKSGIQCMARALAILTGEAEDDTVGFGSEIRSIASRTLLFFEDAFKESNDSRSIRQALRSGLLSAMFNISNRMKEWNSEDDVGATAADLLSYVGGRLFQVSVALEAERAVRKLSNHDFAASGTNSTFTKRWLTFRHQLTERLALMHLRNAAIAEAGHLTRCNYVISCSSCPAT